MSTNILHKPYCNFKYLEKLPSLGDFDLEGSIATKIVLLSRNEVFKKKYQTSKTGFKKLSAEQMNTKAIDASLSHCPNKYHINTSFINYTVIFINAEGGIDEVMRLIRREVTDLVAYLLEKGEITPECNTKHDKISFDLKKAIIEMMVSQYREEELDLLKGDPLQVTLQPEDYGVVIPRNNNVI